VNETRLWRPARLTVVAADSPRSPLNSISLDGGACEQPSDSRANFLAGAPIGRCWCRLGFLPQMELRTGRGNDRRLHAAERGHRSQRLLITALLLPLIAVMAWRCWSLPHVPEIRSWSLAFVAMTLAMLLQGWRAQLWQTRFERLVLQRQEPQLHSQLCPRSAPSLTFVRQNAGQFRVVTALYESQPCLFRAGHETQDHTALLRNTFHNLVAADPKGF
jgi:hypothetical protein